MTIATDGGAVRPLELYDYQETLAETLQDRLAQRRRVMFQLPTGGGKTEILLRLAADNAPALLLTHRQELVDQLVARARLYAIPVHDAYHSRAYVDGVLNVQTIGRYLRHRPSFPHLLLLDEAHHVVARTWFRCLEGHAAYAGATATPWRLSKTQRFDHLFDDLVCGPQTDELIDRQRLSPLKLVIPPWAIDMRREIDRRVRIRRADYAVGDVETLFGQSLTRSAIDAWTEHAFGLKTIFYATSCPTAVRIALILRDMGVACGLVLSDVEAAAADLDVEGIVTDRREAVDAFRAGDLTCLVNYELIAEGFDVPGAHAVVIARPTRSLVFHRQAAGRALRYELHKTAVVIDAAANSCDPQVRHPLHRYPWSLRPRQETADDGEAPVLFCDGCGACEHASARSCSACGVPLGAACKRCGNWRGRKHWRSWQPGKTHNLHCTPCDEEIRQAMRHLSAIIDLLDDVEPAKLYRVLYAAAVAIYLERGGVGAAGAYRQAKRRAHAVCKGDFAHRFTRGVPKLDDVMHLRFTKGEFELAYTYLQQAAKAYVLATEAASFAANPEHPEPAPQGRPHPSTPAQEQPAQPRPWQPPVQKNLFDLEKVS